MEYYSAFKKKEILTVATTWMKLQDIILSEISPVTKRQTLLWVHLGETPGVVRVTDTEGRMLAARAWGEGRYEELWLNGYWGLILQDEKSSRDGWWWRLQSKERALRTAELYTSKQPEGKIYLLWILPQFQIKIRLPWWSSGYESVCYCRGHRFSPWSGKIPLVEEQPSPCATSPGAWVP